MVNESALSLDFGQLSVGVVLSLPLSMEPLTIPFVGMTENEVYVASPAVAVYIYFYDCIACLYNGTINNSKAFKNISTNRVYSSVAVK